MAGSGGVLVECWENQRHVVFKGWGPWRLPTDRPSWSDKSGKTLLFKESFLLPPGWQWENEWTVAPNQDNVDGWYYAADFTIPTRFCSKTSSPLALVRRRKWVRERCKVPPVDLTTVGHQIWSCTSFYGFVGATMEQQMEDQVRQHKGFLRLSTLLHHSDDIVAELGGIEDSPLTTGAGSGFPTTPQQEEEQRSTPLRKSGSNKDQASPSTSTPGANTPADDKRSTTPSQKDIVASSSSSPAASPLSSPALPQQQQQQQQQNRQKLVEYVYKYGVPLALRKSLWQRWCGAVRQRNHDPSHFTNLSQRAALIRDGDTHQEIMQDVTRTAPTHPFFGGKTSLGALRLTNTLLSLSIHDNAPAYNQGFSYIVALLLLMSTPEEAFWMTVQLLRELLPPDYHDAFKFTIDMRILAELVAKTLPELEDHFQRRQIDPTVFAAGWVQGTFCAHFPFATAARLLDVIFFERDSTILVRFILAFLKHNKAQIVETCDGTGALGQFANEWARAAFDVTPVLLVAHKDLHLAKYVAKRRTELRQRE